VPCVVSRWVTDSDYVGEKGYIREGGMDLIPCPAFQRGQKFSISRSGKRDMQF